jgi:flagellin
MAYTINTNIASLQSQEYLRISSEFQQKTINRVTSGLRIISSGDDAAGLAIANSFRSDRTVLVQGVRNINDGLATLQTIDGGLNNISQLLDRARTLAAQSASGTFTGERGVLNSEFQSVITEIDRQSQSIGLDVGGLFAKRLGVFIGGGRGTTSADQIANGSVEVDLSVSNVDARSLGLTGLQVSGAIASEVDQILADSTNTSSVNVPGFTDFYFRGPGFADQNRARVPVNLSGVTDADSLVAALNRALEQAGGGGSASSDAFKAASVRAVVVADSTGVKRISFQSSSAAFQVAAGDRLSNALLGNATTNIGSPLDYIVDGGANVAASGTQFGAARNVIVRIQADSLASPVDLTLAVTTNTTVQTALASLTSLVANNSSLIGAGLSVTSATPGTPIQFTSRRGENFEILAVNDVSNVLGLGTAQNTTVTTTNTFDVTSVVSTVATSTGAETLAISVGGGAYITLAHTFSATSTGAEVAASLNSSFAGSSALQQAGLVASASGATLTISSNNGSYFRISSQTSGATFGFGTTAGATSTTAVSTSSATTSATLNSGGASSTALLAYSPIRNGNDDQTITVSAKDSSGNQQSVAVILQADATAQHGRSLAEAVAYINQRIQSSSSEDLRRIVAIKERDPAAGGVEKIRFTSSLPDFNVSVGSNPGTTGITTSQGSVVSTTTLAGGANIEIESQTTAEAAVSALSLAVSQLGRVQAVVGRGQNQYNFAISLAQTQISNLAASESRIRDADLASEASNLTRAQILQQAGMSALQQANAAPQQVLSLLRG